MKDRNVKIFLGVIAWFEAVCRDLSGDPTFALPYWDWTAKPAFPAQFSDSSVLNPQNPAFFAKKSAFLAAFADPVKTLYQGFSPAQIAQLNLDVSRMSESLQQDSLLRFSQTCSWIALVEVREFVRDQAGGRRVLGIRSGPRSMFTFSTRD